MNIPTNKIGDWRIDNSASYCRLLDKNGATWMADIAKERDSQRFAIDKCHGNVIIGGLGLGWAVEQIAAKPDVLDVIVIELYKEVICLVWPYINKNDKCSIIHSDLTHYLSNLPEENRWNCMYCDIVRQDGRYHFENYMIPVLEEARKKIPKDKIYYWPEKMKRFECLMETNNVSCN